MIPILVENAPLPPTLRVRRWVDFRNPESFEQSFIELISILRGEGIPRGRGGLSPSISISQNPLSAPVVITSAVEADKVNEKLISNLLPVLELPKLVYSSPTPLREKSDLQKLSTAKSHPPFLLRSERLFTLSNLREEKSVFRSVIEQKQIESEEFQTWFGSDKHTWAVKLLNLHLKAFA